MNMGLRTNIRLLPLCLSIAFGSWAQVSSPTGQANSKPQNPAASPSTRAPKLEPSQKTAAQVQPEEPPVPVKTEVGTLEGGSYRIDIPENWNHNLVVYYHGYEAKAHIYQQEHPSGRILQKILNRGYAVVQSGYAGGRVANPSYEQVCTGTTGHAEVVQITFDPQVVSFDDLLHVFFTIHDPTTLNRQGGDVGTQYRSAIFYHTPDQKAAAERVIAELQNEHVWDDPIVTELKPLESFYPAEEYHRDYFRRNPNQGYCSAVIAPKVAKVRKIYLDKLKQPVA